jgi:hypothetical protein
MDGALRPVFGHQGRKVLSCIQQGLREAVFPLDDYTAVICAELALAQPENPCMDRQVQSCSDKLSNSQTLTPASVNCYACIRMVYIYQNVIIGRDNKKRMTRIEPSVVCFVIEHIKNQSMRCQVQSCIDELTDSDTTFNSSTEFSDTTFNSVLVILVCLINKMDDLETTEINRSTLVSRLTDNPSTHCQLRS